MKIPAKFKEYIWLVNTIRKARRITFAEIQEKWLDTDMSEGVELTRSTFSRHRIAIEEMFGIYIDCDRKNGYQYFIGNDDVLHNDSVQNWMLSTLSVSNIISESLSLQDRILLQPVPAEGNYLKMVIDAMKKNVRIEVEYRKYGTDRPNRLDFEPYCLKLFKQRWYVLGHFHRDATEEKPESDYFGLFSFDRIMSMSLTKVKFRIDPDFDAQKYFAEFYGVLADNGTAPEHIVLRAYGYERYYLRDLPIHESQHEIGHGEDFADFELFLRPTVDFSGHILSRGSQLKVLSPKWLADEISVMHKEAAQMYETEEEDNLPNGQ
ncbi:MAG: WYL domain-containing protein [Prevotella sp.]|nr:WYL domain-containing protein [Prevotella sp.]